MSLKTEEHVKAEFRSGLGPEEPKADFGVPKLPSVQDPFTLTPEDKETRDLKYQIAFDRNILENAKPLSGDLSTMTEEIKRNLLIQQENSKFSEARKSLLEDYLRFRKERTVGQESVLSSGSFGVSEQEIEALQALVQQGMDVTNEHKDSIFEKIYVTKSLDAIIENSKKIENEFYHRQLEAEREVEQIEAYVREYDDIAEYAVTSEVIKNFRDEYYGNVYKDTPLSIKATEEVGSAVVPFLSHWYYSYGTDSDDKADTDNFLLYKDLQAFKAYLFSLPPEEVKAHLQLAVDAIAKEHEDNIPFGRTMALEFIDYMMMDNDAIKFFGLIHQVSDLLTFVPATWFLKGMRPKNKPITPKPPSAPTTATPPPVQTPPSTPGTSPSPGPPYKDMGPTPIFRGSIEKFIKPELLKSGKSVNVLPDDPLLKPANDPGRAFIDKEGKAFDLGKSPMYVTPKGAALIAKAKRYKWEVTVSKAENKITLKDKKGNLYTVKYDPKFDPKKKRHVVNVLGDKTPKVSSSIVSVIPPKTTGGRFSIGIDGKNVIAGKVERSKGKKATTSETKELAAAAKVVNKQGKPDPIKGLEAAGHIEDAGTVGLLTRLTDRVRVTGAATKATLWDAFGRASSIANPRALLGDEWKALSKNYTDDLITSNETRIKAFIDNLQDAIRVNRVVDPTVLSELRKAAMENFNNHYYKAANSILDVSWRHNISTKVGDKNIINTDEMTFTIGKDRYSTFETENQAEMYARNVYNLSKGTYDVVADGVGSWVIKITSTMPEKAGTVRNALADVVTVIPGRPSDKLLGVLKGGGSKVSPHLYDDMVTSTLTASNMREFFSAASESFSKLTKKERDRFTAMVNMLKFKTDPYTGLPGVYVTLPQMDRLWQARFNEPAPQSVLTAYNDYVLFNDMAHFVTNLGLTRDKKLLGLKNFRVSNPFMGKMELEGKFVDNWLREDNIDPRIGVLTDDGISGFFPAYFARSAGQGQTLWDLLKMGLDTGELRLIKLAPHSREQIDTIVKAKNNANVPEPDIDYLVIDTKDLVGIGEIGFDHIPRRGGGVIEYAHGYFGKVPRVKARKNEARGIDELHYYNDVTMWQFSTKKQGEFFVKKFNEALDMWDQGKSIIDIQIFINNNLPVTWKQFTDFTKEFPTERMSLVPKGNRIIEVDKNFQRRANLVDRHKKGPDLYKGMVDLQHAIKRNDPVHHVHNQGTDAAPRWLLSDPNVLDPFNTVDANFKSMMKLNNLGDLRIKMAEEFTAAFSHFLDSSWTIERARNFPVDTLFNAPLRSDLTRAEMHMVNKFRRTAKDFFGMKSIVAENIADFEELGLTLMEKAIDKNAPKWLVNKLEALSTSDPSSFFKSVAFWKYMGFFRPRQLLRQAQGVINILALESSDPKLIRDAFAATFWMKPLLLRPNAANIDYAAKMINRATGFAEKDFKDLWNYMELHAIRHIGRENIYRDDLMGGSVVRSSTKATVEAISFAPFLAGERFLRVMAYTTAYMKWRKANPQAVLTDQALIDMAGRADVYWSRMTTAGAAPVQKGITGLMTQMLSFQMRMVELMAGKSLSAAERAKLFLGYSLVYGPLRTAEMALIGLPIATWVIRELQKNEVDPEENAVINLLVNGALTATSKQLTGKQVELGQGGPGALQIWDVIFDDDANVLEKLVGVGIPAVFDLSKPGMDLSQAVLTNFVAAIEGDYSKFPLMKDAMIQAAEEIGTIADINKAALMFTTGKYYNRNGRYIADVDTIDAVMNLIYGNLPADVAKEMSMAKTVRAIERNKTKASGKIRDTFYRAFEALDNGDHNGYSLLFDKAVHMMDLSGFTESDKAQMMNSLGQNWQPKIRDTEKRLEREIK